ncbi:MAG: hypothetical protein AAB443_00330 [Patescibacteria group bacterium]
MKKLPIVLLVIILGLGGYVALSLLSKTAQKTPLPTDVSETAKVREKDVVEDATLEEKKPVLMDPAKIDPLRFTTTINNKYFSLPVGRELTYEGKTEDGLEKIVISINGDTKLVAGVKTLIYRDKVWLDGELVEDTRDYLAQDDMGNVWYFGEDVDNYEDGKLLDHEGAWLAGVDGAEPGLWIKAEHVKGDSYKQEYYKGKAEDMRDVISTSEPLKIKMGSYTNCVKMYDWTPLDKDAREYKYYCAELGAMVLETNFTGGERIELVGIK